MIRMIALTAYPLGMAIGQIMFKLAAGDVQRLQGTSVPRLVIALALNPWFITAVLLYGALSCAWVWILSGMPLSTAYPFVALAFILTPLLGYYFLGETITWTYAAGLGLVIAGLLLVLRSQGA